MTEKDLEEIKQKYGFTLHPRVFNGKPIKHISKEEYEEKINKVWNQIFEDDSKKRTRINYEEIEKKARRKFEKAQKHFNNFKKDCNDWLDNIYKDGVKEND